MTKALPKEERKKIVDAVENNLGTVEEIAKIFNITPRVIYKYLNQFAKTGDLTPLKQPGRPPIITEEVLQIIEQIVLSNPGGILRDYRDKLELQTGIVVTIPTIHKACEELDLRRKKKVFSLQNKKGKMSKKKE